MFNCTYIVHYVHCQKLCDERENATEDRLFVFFFFFCSDCLYNFAER